MLTKRDVSTLSSLRKYCGVKSIEIKISVGEAKWQNGIVERHIGTFRDMLNKMFVEDVFEGAGAQTTVDHVCESKIVLVLITAPRLANGFWDERGILSLIPPMPRHYYHGALDSSNIWR